MENRVRRHFTVTGFVVDGDRTLLHWHAKVKAWLPPGGHIDENENPVEAVLREVKEETGLDVEVVSNAPDLPLTYPEQVKPPFTIMIEDIHDPVDGFHQHIDSIYFCRPLDSATPLNNGWQWVSRDALARHEPLSCPGTPPTVPPDDVRILAIHAFAMVSGL